MNNPCEQANLHSIEQAIAELTLLLKTPLLLAEVGLEAALGRVLAAPITAQIDIPQWDNSAMDGYALNTADLVKEEQALPVHDCQAAGEPAKTLLKQHCMQIFTGAVLPAGANTVVPIENTETKNDKVVFKSVKPDQNIRRKGEETRSGELLLEQGRLLTSKEIGLLASQGIASVPVFQPLRIGVISTGNELCQPGTPLQNGQIYDANSYLLSSLLEGWGFTVTRYPLLKDTLEATQNLLTTAKKEQDILISSGGVSVGDADFVKKAVVQLGTLNLWRVAIQPGKPLAFGAVGSTPWIGLPGNPGASLITALIILRPALLAGQGHTCHTPQTIPALADFTHKSKKRQQYLHARINIKDGRIVANLHPLQSSAMLKNSCWASGLVMIPANTQIESGNTVTFIPYNNVL